MRQIRIIFSFILTLSLIVAVEKKPVKSKPTSIGETWEYSRKDLMEMFHKSLQFLEYRYVDTVDNNALVRSAIDAMYDELDPYSKLLQGKSKERINLLMKGKYAGIGVRIGMRRDTLTVLTPIANSPAKEAGLRAGDKIIRVDTTQVVGMKMNDIRKRIKGPVESTVLLGILRPGNPEPMEFQVQRREIVVKDLQYSGVDEMGIATMKLVRFSKNSANDFRNTLLTLLENGLTGLIIDLRGNGGGLLSQAVNIADLFFGPDTLVVETRFRNPRKNRQYKTRRPKLVPDGLPVAILINKKSASASEIFAGAMQDFDRAIVLGESSVGKGLVQHTFPISDSVKVKITTAKYYLPSGRLVQKKDYGDSEVFTEKESFKDSLFFSAGGRILFGNGGIEPDVLLAQDSPGSFVRYLQKNGCFLNFAAAYSEKKPGRPALSAGALDNFRKENAELIREYKFSNEKQLKKLQKHAKASWKFWTPEARIARSLRKIEKAQNAMKMKLFQKSDNQTWIRNLLKIDFDLIMGGEQAQIASRYEIDNVHESAKILLLNRVIYTSMLRTAEWEKNFGKQDKK